MTNKSPPAIPPKPEETTVIVAAVGATAPIDTTSAAAGNPPGASISVATIAAPPDGNAAVDRHAAVNAAAAVAGATPGAPVAVAVMPARKRLAVSGIFSSRTLALLAILYTLYFAQDILMPLAVAFLLYLVLLPMQRMLVRWHLPQPVAAAVVGIGLLVFTGGGLYSLAAPVTDWASRVPTAMYQLESRFAAIKKPVDDMKKASEKVENMTKLDDDKATPQTVVVRAPGMMERLMGGLRSFGAQLGIVLVVLLFLLASGEMFKEKLVRVMPRLREKKRAVAILRDVEREVSHYLLTVTLINCGVGVCVAAGLWFIGMPNVLLWGVMATILNFIPFLGSLVGAVVILSVGMMSLPDFGGAFIAMGIYLGVHAIESQLVTPAILGRRLALNSVVIILALIVWSWLWGVVGAILAVPLLVFLKVLCDNIDELKVVGEFLSRREIKPTPPADAPAADAQPAPP